MSLKINSTAFYSNYLFHPLKKELSQTDKFKAFFTSLALGIATLGIFHAVCYIKYSNKKVTIANKNSTTEKMNSAAQNGKITPKQQPESEPSFNYIEDKKSRYANFEKQYHKSKSTPELNKKCLDIAIDYDEGRGVPVNKAKALEWARKIINSNTDTWKANAVTILMSIYTKENIQPKDRAEVEWIGKLADVPGLAKNEQLAITQLYDKLNKPFAEQAFKEQAQKIERDRAKYTDEYLKTISKEEFFEARRRRFIKPETAKDLLEKFGENDSEIARQISNNYAYGRDGFEKDDQQAASWNAKAKKLRDVERLNEDLKNEENLVNAPKIDGNACKDVAYKYLDGNHPVDLVKGKKFLLLAVKARNESDVKFGILVRGKLIENTQDVEDLLEMISDQEKAKSATTPEANP